MPTEETYIKFTFPPPNLFKQTMSEKTVQAEFGEFSLNHIELAILLMCDKTIALGGEDTREFLIECLEEVVAKVKTGKGKSVFKLMREMLDE
jgi:hypothetical protein